MRLIDLGTVEALRALALEEAVLESVEAGSGEPAWLLWTAGERSAVLGTARPAAGDLFLERLRAEGVPVWRRRSGGGTVLLGPQSPVVTLVAGGSGSIRDSYLRFCETLIAALDRLGVAAEFRPPADLAVGGRKLAGLAQRRKRRAALVTAAVLARPLAAEAARYLPEPASGDAPTYRAGRAHGEFMTSLAGLGVTPAGERFNEAVRAEVTARGAALAELSTGERSRAAEIEPELADPGWIHRL